MKTRKYVFAVVMSGICLIMLTLGGCDKSKDQDCKSEKISFKVGALIPLTGSVSSMGESSNASLELARTDINAWIASLGMDAGLTLVIEDTRTDTATALEKLKLLDSQGIRMVIGPFTSLEVAYVKEYANLHDILLVSPASVAASLAIPGDNIFRLIPSDRVQEKATSAMLKGDNIKWMVPMVRNDLWGLELLQSATREFESMGGGVAETVKYSSSGKDIVTAVAMLNEAVGEALLTHSPEETGVYMISYSEGTAILREASKMEHLRKVRWYGSSGFGLNALLPADTAAASFAFSRGLPCTIYGLDESARPVWEPLQARIAGAIGHQPDAYATITYDVLWILVRTILASDNEQDISRIKAFFMDESNQYFGASGSTRLNESGDRAFGNYDFWGLRPSASGYEWKRLAWYNSASGTLVRLLP